MTESICGVILGLIFYFVKLDLTIIETFATISKIILKDSTLRNSSKNIISQTDILLSGGSPLELKACIFLEENISCQTNKALSMVNIASTKSIAKCCSEKFQNGTKIFC